MISAHLMGLLESCIVLLWKKILGVAIMPGYLTTDYT